MRAIHRDEERWCAMLLRHLKVFGSEPSSKGGGKGGALNRPRAAAYGQRAATTPPCRFIRESAKRPARDRGARRRLTAAAISSHSSTGPISPAPQTELPLLGPCRFQRVSNAPVDDLNSFCKSRRHQEQERCASHVPSSRFSGTTATTCLCPN